MTPHRLADDANTQILRALGINLKNITAADISLRPGELPRLMVDCLADPHTMVHEVLAFDLVPRNQPAPTPTPALDLDAMCAAAQDRLAFATRISAEWAKEYQREESDAIRTRMDQALRFRKSAARLALSRLEPMGQLDHDLGAAKAEALELLIAKTAASELHSALTERFTRQYAGGI